MGYYTEYTLEVRNIKNKEQFDELHKELEDRGLIGYAFDNGCYPGTVCGPNCINNKHDSIFYPYDEVKWYEHPEVMVMISEKFPNMYFELSGVGESFGDYWKEYYHDGEVETCRGEIVYEEPKKIKWNDLMAI